MALKSWALCISFLGAKICLVTLVFLFVFSSLFLEIESHVALAGCVAKNGLELWSSYLCLLRAGVTIMLHHACFIQCWELNSKPCACQVSIPSVKLHPHPKLYVLETFFSLSQGSVINSGMCSKGIGFHIRGLWEVSLPAAQNFLSITGAVFLTEYLTTELFEISLLWAISEVKHTSYS